MAHATVDRVEGGHQPAAAVLVVGIEEIPLPGRSRSCSPAATLRCPLSDERGNGKGEREIPPPPGIGGFNTISPTATPLKAILCRTVPPKVEIGDGPSKNVHASFSEPFAIRA